METCKHGYDLRHLTEGQRDAVIYNCEIGMIHGETVRTLESLAEIARLQSLTKWEGP